MKPKKNIVDLHVFRIPVKGLFSLIRSVMPGSCVHPVTWIASGATLFEMNLSWSESQNKWNDDPLVGLKSDQACRQSSCLITGYLAIAMATLLRGRLKRLIILLFLDPHLRSFPLQWIMMFQFRDRGMYSSMSHALQKLRQGLSDLVLEQCVCVSVLSIWLITGSFELVFEIHIILTCQYQIWKENNSTEMARKGIFDFLI